MKSKKTSVTSLAVLSGVLAFSGIAGAMGRNPDRDAENRATEAAEQEQKRQQEINQNNSDVNHTLPNPNNSGIGTTGSGMGNTGVGTTVPNTGTPSTPNSVPGTKSGTDSNSSGSGAGSAQ